jgi:hypothetical protein
MARKGQSAVTDGIVVKQTTTEVTAIDSESNLSIVTHGIISAAAFTVVDSKPIGSADRTEEYEDCCGPFLTSGTPTAVCQLHYTYYS